MNIGGQEKCINRYFPVFPIFYFMEVPYVVLNLLYVHFTCASHTETNMEVSETEWMSGNSVKSRKTPRLRRTVRPLGYRASQTCYLCLILFFLSLSLLGQKYIELLVKRIQLRAALLFVKKNWKLGILNLFDMLYLFTIGTHKVCLDGFCCTLKVLEKPNRINPPVSPNDPQFVVLIPS